MGMSGIVRTGTVPLPKWLLFLRIAIIVLSLGVLVASAYNISLYDENIRIYGSSPPGFLIFCVVATWLILGTMLAFEFFLPRFYIRVVFIVLLVLDSIFWLSAWTWAASWAGQVDDLGRMLGGTAFYQKFYGSVAAAAALGAVVWAMLVVFVGLFVRACLRDNRGARVVEAREMEQGANGYPPPPQQHYA